MLVTLNYGIPMIGKRHQWSPPPKNIQCHYDKGKLEINEEAKNVNK